MTEEIIITTILLAPDNFKTCTAASLWSGVLEAHRNHSIKLL